MMSSTPGLLLAGQNLEGNFKSRLISNWLSFRTTVFTFLFIKNLQRSQSIIKESKDNNECNAVSFGTSLKRIKYLELTRYLSNCGKFNFLLKWSTVFPLQY